MFQKKSSRPPVKNKSTEQLSLQSQQEQASLSQENFLVSSYGCFIKAAGRTQQRRNSWIKYAAKSGFMKIEGSQDSKYRVNCTADLCKNCATDCKVTCADLCLDLGKMVNPNSPKRLFRCSHKKQGLYYHGNHTYEMLCAVWQHLYHLKNVKSTSERSVALLYRCYPHFLNSTNF